MGAQEIEAFLSHLAVNRKVSSSTQNQAFNALLFLYREVLKKELDESINAVRAKKPQYLPAVMTKEEVKRVIASTPFEYQLMVRIIYGSGLRLMECLRLRIKDIDFGNHQILVRDAKGMKNRVTVLPDKLAESLRAHLEGVRTSLSALCIGKEVSECKYGMGLAVCISCKKPVKGPQNRRNQAPPCP
jgi:integrase